MNSITDDICNSTRKKTILTRHGNETFDCAKYSSITRNNREQITLIWLDIQLQQRSQFTDDIDRTEEMLRELNDYVLLFSNESECLTRMESIKNETILLVISGSSASQNFLEKTHQIRHVDSIFIFCQNKRLYEPLLLNKDYCKLTGVFYEREPLASCITRSIELVNKQSAIFALYNVDKQKSARNLTRESGSFIFLQLVKQVLQKMLSNKEATQASKAEMLERCRLYYRGNRKALSDIDRFDRTYTPNQAIEWYTADSFLYRLINKSLRTEDIDELYKYRFYIVDLCACLAEQSKLLYDSTTKMNVYRGVKLPQGERQRLCESIGHLISVNGYFSTSRNLKVSEAYAGVGSNHVCHGLDCVIFDIEVDLQQYPETILADVRHLSRFSDEEEVLFDIGTVFKILSVDRNEKKQYWHFRLRATDEGRSIAKEYVDLKQLEFNESNDVECTFGTLIFDMGEWRQSRIYFENLDKRRPNDPYVRFGIGRSYYNSDYPEQALKYFQEAYNLCMKDDEKLSKLAAKICCHMSRVYIDCSNYQEALLVANKAMKLYQLVGEENARLGIAQTLVCFGLVYLHQGKDDECLKNFERAHSIMKDVYKCNHPEISACLVFLSCAYYHKGDYEKSLSSVLESLATDRVLLPKVHPSIYYQENNIGKQYYKLGKYKEALERFRRCDIICSDTSSNGSRYRGITLNNIGKTYYRLNQLDEADKYYDRALKLFREFFSSATERKDLAYTFKNMGEVQLARGNIANALQLFQRAHDMYDHICARGDNHRDVAKCKYLMALAHATNANHIEASSMFEKALKMWRNVLSADHPDIALCHQSMAEYHTPRRGFQEEAIMHFQMALSILEKRLPSDHQEIAYIRRELRKLKRRQELQIFIKNVQVNSLSMLCYGHILTELFHVIIDNIRGIL